MEKYLNLLNSLALLNYDDGKKFTKRDRLDAINDILKRGNYKKVNSSGLFELYALNGELPEEAVLISTHVDCAYSLTKCFVEEYQTDYLLGTFDNLITNALTVLLMSENRFNNNVIFAFTGDEERDSQGVYAVIEFLRAHNCSFTAVVLDVTDMGWDDDASFTIENNFWSDDLGKRVIDAAKNNQYKWRFVPSDEEDIPYYVPREVVIETEAECDESWAYDEKNIACFSLCIPVKGDMHSNEGVIVRKGSIEKFTEMLKIIANTIY